METLGHVTWPTPMLLELDRTRLSAIGDTFSGSGDCAICGRLLQEPPWSAAVDVMRNSEANSTMFHITLMHPRCTGVRPAWNDTGVLISMSGTSTFTAEVGWLLHEAQGRAPDQRSWWRREAPAKPALMVPAMLINPSYEHVTLSKRADGSIWDVTLEHMVNAGGWHSATPATLRGEEPFDTTTPVNAAARVRGGDLVINLGEVTWSAPITPAHRRAYAETGYCLVLVAREPNLATRGGLPDPEAWAEALLASCTAPTSSPGIVYGVFPIEGA